jgi:hypothetical protein
VIHAFPSSLVTECSFYGTYIGAPAAEIALSLGIVLPCCPGRAGLFAFLTVDTGPGPPQPEPAEFSKQGEEDPKGADKPADRAVDKH